MLLRQNGGRNKISHLLVFLHGLERSSYCNLRLSKAHISADKPVHYAGAFHIGLGILDGTDLILRLLVGKELFKLRLPYGIFPVDISRYLLPFRI